MLRIEYEPLSVLLDSVWAGNPKAHDLDALDTSMSRFGYTAPVTRDETTERLIAGHGRITNLAKRKASGEARPRRVLLREEVPAGQLSPAANEAPGDDWYVPVIRGLRFGSEEEAAAYLLADNRISEMGGWDDALLAPMLAQQLDSEQGLAGLGWTDEQARDLIASITRNSEPPGEPPAENVTPPEEFREFDEGKKKTVQCARCGFSVVCE